MAELEEELKVRRCSYLGHKHFGFSSCRPAVEEHYWPAKMNAVSYIVQHFLYCRVNWMSKFYRSFLIGKVQHLLLCLKGTFNSTQWGVCVCCHLWQ